MVVVPQSDLLRHGNIQLCDRALRTAGRAERLAAIGLPHGAHLEALLRAECLRAHGVDAVGLLEQIGELLLAIRLRAGSAVRSSGGFGLSSEFRMDSGGPGSRSDALCMHLAGLAALAPESGAPPRRLKIFR